MAKAEKRIRVLVIDDQEAVRESIKMHLEDLGYDVLAAAEPASCPVYYHEHCSVAERCADIMFIDQTMPNMNGLEFLQLQAARGCKLTPQFKILMTGLVTEEIRRQAEALGCQVVQKPLRLDDVTALVQKAQENRKPA